MRILVVSTLLLLVAGCATDAERAAAVERDIDAMMRVYGPGCEKLGFKPNSDPWRDCVLRLATYDRLERREFTTTNCFRNGGGFIHCSTF